MKRSAFRSFRLISILLLALGLFGCQSGEDDVLQGDLNGGGDGVTPFGEPVGPGNEFPLPPRDPGSMLPVGMAVAPVYFGYDSFSVAPSEMSKVQQVADTLISSPGYSVVIQGHTDERGSREYNLALGERRALAVRELLISFGVESSRIQTLSFGEEQPAVPGFDESAFSMNRRAEFQVMQ